MCKSTLHGFLQALPKCEQHMHLEGALTPELMFKLAEKNHITLPTEDAAFESVEALTSRYQRFTSLDDFLQYYFLGISVLIEAMDFEELAWDYFKHAARDNVAHAEVFFDSQAHLPRGVQYQTILSGFQAARSRAERELGITSELICCFLRHLSPDDCSSMFALKEVRDSFERGEVRGIGLDSSELDNPPQLFKDLYQDAKARGIRRTAHAGEEAPASYIKTAIDVLDVERIDHGIRLADDPELVKSVAAKGILLTVCPLSNVLLQCATSVAALPIRQFLDAGVDFSINSDDPAYFGGHYILDNYCAVQEAFQLTHAEWGRIARASICGSWCGDERKTELLASLDRVMKQWTP